MFLVRRGTQVTGPERKTAFRGSLKSALLHAVQQINCGTPTKVKVAVRNNPSKILAACREVIVGHAIGQRVVEHHAPGRRFYQSALLIALNTVPFKTFALRQSNLDRGMPRYLAQLKSHEHLFG